MVKQDDQQFAYAYDTGNRLVSRTDAAGRITAYAWDAADRVTTLTLPSGKAYHYTYDPNGNRIGITMPSGSVHALAYDALNQATGYTPPGSAAYSRVLDADRMGTHFALPSGRTTDVLYDAGGRPTSQSNHTGPTLDGHTTLAYASGDPTSRVSVATREVPGAFTTATSLTYDGSLLTGKAVVTGADADYNGASTYVYDNDFLVTQRKLSSGGDTVTQAISRNIDRLVTQDGRFAIARNGPAGSASSYSDAAANLALTYDASARVSTRTFTVGGTQVYRVALTYDNAGQISQRVETVGGTPQTYAYGYTADDFLARRDEGRIAARAVHVRRQWQSNSRLVSGVAETSTYDAQDRLTQRGATNYLFDADGYLQARGADTFDYSAEGELLSAHAGGQTIDYAYDAYGRRVGRTVGGAREAYFYGDPRRPFLTTAVRDSAHVLTTYYYDDDGLLYALDRGGVHYYVGTDQIGTPHVVTDASGTVVKTLTYDSFGSLVSDSNPSFALPIGFAGGLVDPTTRLVRFGLRDYDPDAGRWTARDPVFFDAPAVNLYAYTDNNPLSFRDTSGLDWSWEGFKSTASEYGGRAVDWVKANYGRIADFAAEQLGKVSDKVKLGKETWDKGKKVVDTANDVEETILTVEENMQQPVNGNQSGNQAAALLKCGLKWLKKAHLPFDFITENASATIDQVRGRGQQGLRRGDRVRRRITRVPRCSKGEQDLPP